MIEGVQKRKQIWYQKHCQIWCDIKQLRPPKWKRKPNWQYMAKKKMVPILCVCCVMFGNIMISKYHMCLGGWALFAWWTKHQISGQTFQGIALFTTMLFNLSSYLLLSYQIAHNIIENIHFSITIFSTSICWLKHHIYKNAYVYVAPLFSNIEQEILAISSNHMNASEWLGLDSIFAAHCGTHNIEFSFLWTILCFDWFEKSRDRGNNT